ncbi:hypothetical protein GSI_08766 [Ganoderma sinense ZZ0214-1]|nr:hypothetical protein GSI_08766 [Ganoderma sinense ZZ0214-1]
MVRDDVYLAHDARLPINICVDTCSEDANSHSKDLLLVLHLKVAKLDCKLSARHVLGTCGSGPALRAIQHWHV